MVAMIDDAKLMQGVKKKLKTIDNHALKFCKQGLFYTFFFPKVVFGPKPTKQDFGKTLKLSLIQNYDCQVEKKRNRSGKVTARRQMDAAGTPKR
jgi:hypothetical protein